MGGAFLGGIAGTVVHGDGRGRELGFPTANIDCPLECLPPDGIYAAFVRLDQDDRIRASIVSVGRNPTFGDGQQPRAEVHIIDFDEWIYGREITVEFLLHMRDMACYKSASTMVEQALLDLARCRALFNALSAQVEPVGAVRDLECW